MIEVIECSGNNRYTFAAQRDRRSHALASTCTVGAVVPEAIGPTLRARLKGQHRQHLQRGGSGGLGAGGQYRWCRCSCLSLWWADRTGGTGEMYLSAARPSYLSRMDQTVAEWRPEGARGGSCVSATGRIQLLLVILSSSNIPNRSSSCLFPHYHLPYSSYHLASSRDQQQADGSSFLGP